MARRVSSPILIGRRGELARVEFALRQAAAGEAGVVTVAGEAGIGKTRLLGAVAEGARESGFQVLAGGCVSLSAESAPFAPIVEALRTLTRDLAPSELDGVLGARGARGLQGLLPDLAPASELPDATGVSPDSRSARTLDLLFELLGRLAIRSPVLLIVEDLHWADQSTIDLLAFLARNLSSERVLLLASVRTDDHASRPRLLPLFAELARHPRSERIALEPLNREEVADQLAAILGSPPASPLIEAIYSRTQGNPFFSEELLASESVVTSMPDTLADVLSARVAALTEDARELVRVASAAGRQFSEDLLARVVGGDDAAFGTALREALEHKVLIRGDAEGHLAFRHALVQELMYADLLPRERVRLHDECARAIEGSAVVASDPVLASELAYHWQAAQQPERAMRAAIAAGLAAEGAGARTEAGLQFERALELLGAVPESEPRLPLGRIQLLEHAALNLQDEPARAIAHIRTAIDLSDPEGDPVHCGLLHAALGRYLWFSGDGAAALAACRQAVALVPAEPPSVPRAQVAAGLGQILMILALIEEGVPHCEEAVRIAAASGAKAIESHALNTLGVLKAYLGDVDGGLAALHRALEIADEIGSIADVERAHMNILDVLTFPAARYDEAATYGIQAIGSGDAPSFTGIGRGVLQADTAAALYFAGRWDEALDLLQRARVHPASGAAEISIRLRAAQLHVGSGDFDSARSDLAILAPLLAGTEDVQWLWPFSAATAELAIWARDPAEALRVIAEALERAPPFSGALVARMGPLRALGVRAAVELEAAHGRRRSRTPRSGGRDQALEHVAAIRRFRKQVATRSRVHLPQADAYLALSEAEWSRIEAPKDSEPWRAAAKRFANLGHPYIRAYALYREGEALLATPGQRSAARVALLQAFAVADQLGARPLRTAIEGVAARGRVTLRAHGESTRSAAPGGLTVRETEILSLVADGLTNRQIAERLFITEKTVGHHVSNILGKLGAAGRAEAAAVAVRLGIVHTPRSEAR